MLTTLLWTRDVDSYIHAIGELVVHNSCARVPVLARDLAELRGFGSLRIKSTQWPPPVYLEKSKSRILDFLKTLEPAGSDIALCVTTDDAICLAVAALLCLGCANRFVLLRKSNLTPDLIATLVEQYAPRSIAFVVPPLLLSTTSSLQPTQLLKSLIRAVRISDAEIELPPFGIVTGVDPGAMTQLAAKTVLSRPIAQFYADGNVCFVDEDGPPSGLKKRRAPQILSATPLRCRASKVNL